MKSLIHFLLILPILFLFSCSGLDKNSETPEGVYAIAEEFEKDERYDEAIRRYQDVKNKFPYSNWATRAELAIADVHFKDEAYPEAQIAYQSFRELHPRHAKIDYVVYRIGMSYYNQLPATIDRDLTLAHDAIQAFDDLLANYPQSEHAKEAGEKRSESLKKLAEKEDYIGDFYFKRGKYLPAFSRYENLVSKYPGQGFDAKALSRAAISAHKISRTDTARQYLNQLRQQFPKSKEYNEARRVIE